MAMNTIAKLLLEKKELTDGMDLGVPGYEKVSVKQGAGKGLLVTAMFGPSLNANTGDWSAGVSGFWFEGGGIAHPVSEITVAGNLKDLWARLVAGSDLEFRGSFNSPSLLFDAVAIAGK